MSNATVSPPPAHKDQLPGPAPSAMATSQHPPLTHPGERLGLGMPPAGVGTPGAASVFDETLPGLRAPRSTRRVLRNPTAAL